MAKKTNKTEHVLSLLSGAGAVSEKEEAKAAKSSPVTEIPAADLQGNVHVVMAPGAREDPVAEIVKQKLEEQLLEELDRQEEPVLAAQEDGEQRTALSTDEVPEVREEIPAQKAFAAPGNNSIQEASVTQDKSAAPEAEKQGQAEKDREPEEMDGYVFYNIMERIVKDKAMKYMKQFGNCTCRRCEADTIALALSKLPPKYVVAKEDSVSPLVNFYEDHFAGQVIVEITKACIVVNKNPRHNTK